MLKNTLSGFNVLNDIILNNSLVQNNIKPLSLNTDIGSPTNKFNNIYANNTLFSNITVTNSLLTNITVTNSLLTNINSINITSSNLNTINITSSNIVSSNLIVNNLTSSNLISNNVLSTNIVSNNISVGNLQISNISYPLVYTSGNLSVGIDNATIRISTRGNLYVSTLDAIKTSDPLKSRNLTDYLAFVGLTVEQLAALLGVSTGSLENLIFLSLQYNSTDFKINNSKLTLNLPNNNYVPFVNNGNLVGMSYFQASLGAGNVTISNLNCNNIQGTNFNYTNATISNLLGTNSSISNLLGTNLVETNGSISNLLGTNLLETNGSISNLNTTNASISNSTISNLNCFLAISKAFIPLKLS